MWCTKLLGLDAPKQLDTSTALVKASAFSDRTQGAVLSLRARRFPHSKTLHGLLASFPLVQGSAICTHFPRAHHPQAALFPAQAAVVELAAVWPPTAGLGWGKPAQVRGRDPEVGTAARGDPPPGALRPAPSLVSFLELGQPQALPGSRDAE